MNNNQTQNLKKDVMTKLIEAFYFNEFESSVNFIPLNMRPKNKAVPYRCCIHKERAILRERTIANLGFAIEDDDEITSLNQYAQNAINREKPESNVLTVIDTACKGCTPSRIYVTDLCQGCVARPCEGSCNFDAITIQNGKSVIDGSKCKNCTKCIQVCPYNAITKIRVPCEEACPVNSIKKNDVGFAEIDYEKCIYCGACVSACPFAAVAEKSHIIDILKNIKSGKQVIAMLAPSIVGQFSESIEKIAKGLIEVGFNSVYEVAQGADITARHEAKDFNQRIDNGDEFMTTSCCAAYNNLVEKHVPELKPFVSETKTPMYYTAEIVKQQHPDSISVFIGPCVAKRVEGLNDKNIDYVMNYEETAALFSARNIELSNCDDYKFSVESSKQGRNFAVSGGVAESVKIATSIDGYLINEVCINGLDKKSIRELKSFANKKECSCGNLVEVMACSGGCVGGSATLVNTKTASRKISSYAHEGNDLA